MSTITEKLEMLISLDPSQGIDGLKRMAQSAETETAKVESSIGKIGTAALKLGVGGLAAGGFLTQMASGDIEAAQQLEAAIQTTGHSVDEYKDRIDAAESAMAKFGHTDEEVNGALRVLVGSYGDTNKALDQMQLTADLAAFKHISLADAANIVAKAHGGAGRVFKEFNIQVQTNADGTKNYDGALTELSKKLSGQASASADSFGGKLRELRADIENQVSDFGQKWGPTIMAASGGLSVFGAGLSGASSLAQKFGKDISATQIGVGAFAGAVGVGAVAGLYAFGQSLNKTTLDMQELKSITEHSADDAAKALDTIREKSVGPFADMYRDALKKIADSGDAGVGVLKSYSQHLHATGQDASVVDGVLNSLSDAEKNQADNAANARDKTQLLDAAYKHLHDTIHASIDPVFALNKAINDDTAAQRSATAAAMAVAQAQDAYNNAVAQFGPNSDQATTAGLALLDAQTKLSAANDDVATSALSVNDAAQQLSKGMSDGSISADQMKATLNGWVQQGLLTSAQAQDIADRLGVVIDKAGQLDGKSINFSVNGEFTATGDLANIIGLGLSGPGVHRAAAGFAGTINRPTPFLVGEGGEPEDVVVVPHSKGGIGGFMGAGKSAGHIQNFYISANEPVAAAYEIAQIENARQFMGR